MAPTADPQTAATWRRTRHIREALALVRYLDGTRTVPEAAEEAGIANPTIGWRIMASLRHIALEAPELVELDELREGRKVYYTARLLPATGKRQPPKSRPGGAR